MNKLSNIKIKNLVESLNYKLVKIEYFNKRARITIQDTNGYNFLCVSYTLKENKTHKKFHKSNPYTIDNIKLWCKLNNKPFELISESYDGSDKNLQWKCLKDDCGEIFEMSWDNILQNHGCGYCAGQKVGLSNCLVTKRPELVAEWHPTKNGKLTPYDVTYGCNKDVWWKCKNNSKHEWVVSINTRNNNNSGCPYCAGLFPSEDYNLLVCNPDLCDEWNYDKNNKNPEDYTPNSGQYVWWKCKECGYEWESRIVDRSKNKGCSKCIQSKGENIIQCYLYNNNIVNYFQYKFDDCRNINSLPFDFYLPLYNCCIEYQGIQHYEPIEFFGGEKQFQLQQKLDQIKRNFCRNNNIKLIEIPYWDFDNIEQILAKELNLQIKAS